MTGVLITLWDLRSCWTVINGKGITVTVVVIVVVFVNNNYYCDSDTGCVC